MGSNKVTRKGNHNVGGHCNTNNQTWMGLYRIKRRKKQMKKEKNEE